MKLITSTMLNNDSCRSTLAFTTTGGSLNSWPVWDRYISLNGEQLYHIGNICNTCEFFFAQLNDRRVSDFEIDSIRSSLEYGISSLSDVSSAFYEIIPNGKYTVALFTAFPKQSGVNGIDDYFMSEQRLAWFDWDTDTRRSSSAYFRGESYRFGDDEMLFEFFIPLYDISVVDRSRVEYYKQLIMSGARPTAVALSVLDTKTTMTYPKDEKGVEIEPEYRTHFCFAHYLLDGHHKVVASHEMGLPITLLTFVSHDESFSGLDEVLAYYSNH